VKHVLDFLQLKSETLSVNTMKGYVTAISRRHSMVQGQPLGLDPSIRRWIKGFEHTKGIPRMILPTWCLELVLATLSEPPFEPIRTCRLKYLTWKTVFLLAITSGRRASEMHALCCKPPYIRFSSAGVTLFTNLEFLPKVYTKANASRPIHVPAMRNPRDGALRKLCVRRALNEYVRRSGTYRLDGATQLFVAYGGRVKGKPISKQRLSNWLVECIKFTYEKHILPVPDGVKGHQTRKMAVTYADMAGADPQTICEAATWQNTNTFARFYRLDAVANSDAEFGRRVLTLAGSSTPAPVDWGGYRIPRRQHLRR